MVAFASIPWVEKSNFLSWAVIIKIFTLSMNCQNFLPLPLYLPVLICASGFTTIVICTLCSMLMNAISYLNLSKVLVHLRIVYSLTNSTNIDTRSWL